MPTALRIAAALLLASGMVATAASYALAQPADEAAQPPAQPVEDDEGDGLFAEPEPGEGDDAPPVRVEGEDLPIDETIEIDADQATFRYSAQGPGMLTLLAHAPGERTRVQLQVKDAQGRLIPGGMANGNNNANNFAPRLVVDANGNPVGQLPGLTYLTLPITQEGDYQIEMSVTGEADGPVKVGGAWVGFEQLAAPAAAVPVAPAVPVQPPAPFDPTEVARELALGEEVQLEIDGDTNNGWIKLTAGDVGTLVVVTNARRADVRLAVFAEGQFADPIEYVDSDRQGSVGREALMFRSGADETWYIRVTARGAEHVPLGTTFIPDDLEVADPQDGDQDE